MKKATLLSLLVLAVLSGPRSFGQTVPAAKSSFEVITDIDLGFLITDPKIPWGDDPFLRVPGYATVPSVSEKFKLGGIFFSQNAPMAVVNGKTVHEGDRVDGRLISEIGENYVILKKRHSEIELNLPPLINEKFDDELKYELLPEPKTEVPTEVKAESVLGQPEQSAEATAESKAEPKPETVVAPKESLEGTQ